MNLPLDSDLDFLCCSSTFFFISSILKEFFLREIRLLSFVELFIFYFVTYRFFCQMLRMSYHC